MKRKSITAVSIIALIAAMCSVLICMTACGGADVKVKISDCGVVTEADAKTNMKISEILEKASISLGDKDETEPAADEEIKDNTEIIIKRYAKVTVKYGKDEKTVELVGGKVEDAVDKAGFKLNDGVAVDADKGDYLKDGMVITLSNSIEVSLTADGKTNKVKTNAETVKAFLDEQKVKLGKDDEVSPSLDSKIKDDLKITVKRVEYKEVTEKESIDYKTEEKESSSLSAGQTQVTQEGSEGEKTVTYKVKYVDGKEQSKEKVKEEVTKQPVNKVVTVGTAAQSSAAQSSQSDSPATSSQSQQSQQSQGGKKIVSKQAVYDCDGSGHGYYDITYSDGTHEYVEF